MRRFQISVLLVLALLTSAVAFVAVLALRQDLASLLSTQNGTDRRQSAPTTASVPRQPSPGGDKSGLGKPATPAVPTFDAVQVGADAPSVFAGRAPPRSHVTILSNQRPIATVTADESGEWVAVIEEKIGAGEHQFSLTAKQGQDGVLAHGQIVRRTVAPGATSALAIAVSPVPLPRPITFAYDAAIFTSEGRRSASALAEYLRTLQHQAVTLSGHADERGSDGYNMELSRHRLEAVARFLRESGITAELVLLPKGRSEPFSAVDRRFLAREDALQLDRRVELRGPLP